MALGFVAATGGAGKNKHKLMVDYSSYMGECIASVVNVNECSNICTTAKMWGLVLFFDVGYDFRALRCRIERLSSISLC